MTSLAAFAPTTATAALKARPTARRTATAGTVAVRAGVPQKNRESRQPIINTRRALLGGAVSAAVSLALTPGRADAKDGKNGVYWIAPKDGATVPRSFTVKMGVKGFEVLPVAEGLQEGTGHHHIVVDGKYVEKGDTIPFDATHLHYGKAQKEVTIELAPGPHTLTLQFANANHQSYGKKFAKTISINVE